VLKVNKLKIFLQHHSDIDTEHQDLNFNDFSSEKLARAKLINYKNAAQLALLMLK
jgi:hypothetical protein